MLKIRLKKVGRKGQPSYRIVVTDSTTPRDGRTVEEIGTYNPRRSPAEVHVDLAAAHAWKKKGARATGTVARILNSAARSSS